jgi:hypothetical protein
MGYPEVTARQSAWQIMKTTDPRMSVLRRFADAMGISLNELGRKGKRMARRLETELAECGCSMDAKMFRDLVVERHGRMHTSWTEDDLVCHPDEAKAFCQTIRSEVGAEVPDHVILRTLLNARKAH